MRTSPELSPKLSPSKKEFPRVNQLPIRVQLEAARILSMVNHPQAEKEIPGEIKNIIEMIQSKNSPNVIDRTVRGIVYHDWTDKDFVSLLDMLSQKNPRLATLIEVRKTLNIFNTGYKK